MSKLLKQAFTLIELLVVIAIIGILSGLIVVSMGGMTTKASVAKMQVFSNSLRNSMMTSLVAEWNFDNTVGTVGSTLAGGTVIYDTWKANNGTANGGPILKDGTDCVSGKCLSFDGSDDYITIPRSSNYSAPTSFEMWIKPNSYGTASWGRVLASYEDTGCGYGYAFFIKTGGGLSVITNDWNISAGINLSNWSHLIFVQQSTGTSSFSRAFYLNGVKIGTQNVSSTLPESTSSNMTIGGSNPCWYSSTTFDGLMDNVRIYNAAVSISQAKEQYYAGLNSLLVNGNINAKEYSERINSISINE